MEEKKPDNKFTLVGRVGSEPDIEYKESGTVLTKINLGYRKGKVEGQAVYDNFYITFFNTKKDNTAERLAEEIKEGDYIRVEGKLTINKYKPEGAEKYKYTTQLLGWGFKKVQWDKDAKCFVDVETDTQETEHTAESPAEEEPIVQFNDEEIPF